MKRQLLFLTSVFISTLWVGGCGGSEDDPKKTCTAAPVVSAGPDQIGFGNGMLTLKGTTDGAQGTWTILEGSGGEISTDVNPVFTASQGNYKLKWEATNECGTTSDEMSITIQPCGSQTIEEFIDNIHWIQIIPGHFIIGF